MASGGGPAGGGAKPRPHKLDPYKEWIRAQLEAYPGLTARRLCDEVRELGYAGGYSRVAEFVQLLRPRPEPEPPVRFETPPGHQAQVDFGTFRTDWGKSHALVVVLGYSRLQWVGFYPRQTMQVVMQGLEAAFGHFGGVPQELLFDQMKAVVIDDRCEQGERLLLNHTFRQFAAHWDFTIRACRPYRAQTKGKVERQIRYLRQGFFYGRTFLNADDLNAQASSWLAKVANARVHATTGERPQVRFERDERGLLQPLAPRSFLAGPMPAAEARPRPAVAVARRPLSAYAELVR